MEKWEYLTEFTYANVGNTGWEEYRKQNWPNFRPKQFDPHTMIPSLNARGNDGWELVHMEPVPLGIGNNHDLASTQGGYSNIYFCVFKRRKT